MYLWCVLPMLVASLCTQSQEIYPESNIVIYKQSGVIQDSDLNDSDLDDSYREIYELLGVEDMEEELERSGLADKLNVSGLLEALMRGDTAYISKSFGQAVKSTVFGELESNRRLLTQLIAIVLLGSIFVNLSNSFGNGFVSENGFYVTYLICTSIMLSTFAISLDIVSSAIEKILILIRIIVPVFSLAMNFVGHPQSAYGMYQVILVGIWLVQAVIMKFVLPMIKFYVLVSLLNNLNREDSFSKMSELVKSFVRWMLKTVIFFIVGLNIIKSLIEPQIDALGRNTVNRVINAIPGGGIASVLTGTFLGAGLVVKNSIGLIGIVLLGLIVMIPLAKSFMLMLSVKLTAVIIQPIGEKRYVLAMEALSDGMSLLMQALGSSVVLFMLTIALMAYSTGS